MTFLILFHQHSHTFTHRFCSPSFLPASNRDVCAKICRLDGGYRRDSNTGVMVSIIVPARNEEQGIAKCLDSLVNQTYQNLEIIVVDDSSTDKTSKITESFEERNHRVRLVSAGEKPEGWVGKAGRAGEDMNSLVASTCYL